MTGRASRRKGAEYEREICRDFARYGFTGRRTPNSGGLSVKSDITGPEGAPTFPGCHIEAKRRETLALPAWLAQAHAAAGGALTPLVIFRRDARTPSDPLRHSHICLPLEDWLADQQELRELRAIRAVARRQGEAFAEFDLTDALEAYDSALGKAAA